MAHFAEIINNKVARVIVVSDLDTQDANGIEKEEIGIEFCKSLFGDNTKWVQTSYNNSTKGTYAGVGYFYDEANDVFFEDESLGIPLEEEIIDAEIVQSEIAAPVKK
jgi:hypothetical protein